MPDAVPDIRIGGKFSVAAVSRHPRLGIDYDLRAHKFKDSYLNPQSYGIAITDFPGKKLVKEASRDHSGPGSDPLSTVSWWELTDCLTTAGWSFAVSGRPDGALGQIGRPFTATHYNGLPTPVGQFDDEGSNNAWNWTFNVPGPGTYTVDVTRVDKVPAKNTTKTHKLRIEDYLVVSIGDSAASGEGNPDIPGKPAAFDPDISWWEVLVVPVGIYKLTKEAISWASNKLMATFPTITAAASGAIDMDPAPVWLEPLAHRSLLGGHSMAAKWLEDRPEGRVITYLPLGRTGSSIRNGLLGARSAADPIAIGQITEMKSMVGNRQIEALLIYMGVNEIGVASNLSALSNDFLKSDTTNRQQVEDDAYARLRQIPAKFLELERALSLLNIRHVYITEYPESLFNDGQDNPSDACGIFESKYDLDITPRDATFIRDIMVALNAALQNEVAQRADKGWFYIGGIANEFKGHGYCTSDSYFVFAEESLAQQGDTMGTVHPNAAGAKKIAERVRQEVESHTMSSARVDGQAPTDAGNTRSVPVPQAPAAPLPAPAAGS